MFSEYHIQVWSNFGPVEEILTDSRQQTPSDGKHSVKAFALVKALTCYKWMNPHYIQYMIVLTFAKLAVNKTHSNNSPIFFRYSST